MPTSPAALAASPTAPSYDCPLCPRLVAFRDDARAKHPDWFNGPVPSFGPADARLLIVGLAPGLQGANRTGRPFTGDYAGVLLYDTLIRYGFARGVFEARPDDSLELIDARISNGVRCVPPENKPTTVEIATCRQFLTATIASMPRVKVMVALGRIAHDTALVALGAKRSHFAFGHNAVHRVGDLTLIDSYHCSRYNTNTGVLTTEMFQAVFAKVRAHIDGKA